MTKWKFLLAAMVILLLGCGEAVVATAVVGHTQKLVIEKPGESSVSALRLFESQPERIATRLLLVTPSGFHLVLTAVQEVRSGLFRFRLLVEETGWWAEVELHTGLGAVDSETFLARTNNESWPSQIPTHLRVASGVECDGLLSYSEGVFDIRGWLAVVRSDGTSCGSSLRIPSQLYPAVRFLAATLPRDYEPDHPAQELWGASWGPIIDMLAIALQQQGELLKEDDASHGWVVQAQGPRRGSTLSLADDLEFMAGFASVENVDPLSDLRLPEDPPVDEVVVHE